MIRFACPVCNTHITVSADTAGEVDSCPQCGQLVQVPAASVDYDTLEDRRVKRRREGMRAFLDLIRLFLWGLCLAAVVTSVLNYFQQFEREADHPAKTSLAVQALVWIFSAFTVA